MNEITVTAPTPPSLGRWIAALVLATLAWIFAYAHLTEVADALVAMTGLERGTHLGEAVHFFSTTRPRCCCCSPASSS